MSAEHLERLVRDLSQMVRAESDEVASGSAESHAAYQNLAGQITGLKRARRLVLECFDDRTRETIENRHP